MPTYDGRRCDHSGARTGYTIDGGFFIPHAVYYFAVQRGPVWSFIRIWRICIHLAARSSTLHLSLSLRENNLFTLRQNLG